MTLVSNVLKDIPLFHSLPSSAMKSVAGYCNLQYFSSSQPIITQDDALEHIFFIIYGRTGIECHISARRKVIILELSKGDVLGLPLLTDDNFYPITARALCPTATVIIPAEKFRRILLTYPKISFLLNRYLVNLLQTLSRRIIEFNALDVNSRIHAELLRIASDVEATNNAVTIKPVPTHIEIASRISTHREAVTREFKALESRGLIERGAGILTIPDISKFREMTGQGD